MKNAKKILFTLFAVLLVGAATAQAYLQDPNYGATPEEREQTARSVSYLGDALKMKDYSRASELLSDLLANHPLSSRNNYIRGVMMYQDRTKTASSLPERNSMIDSLMWVYGKWNDSFGALDASVRADILRRKALDYALFKAADSEGVLRYYNEAIEASAGKDTDLLKRYFATLTSDYQADLVDTDEYVSEYERVTGYLAAAGESAAEDLAQIETAFASTDAASGEILEQLYAPKYAENPNDVALMRKILAGMTRAKYQSDFMLEVAENLYKVEKSPETGVYLAAIFEERKDYEKSLFYWEESINSESDPTKKHDFLMSAATSALAMENYRQAITYARQALDINSNNGMAHLIIAQAHGASIGCSNDFMRQAAHWLIVDELQRARSLLAGNTEQVALVNQRIASHTARFPSKTDVFFLGLQPGASFTVNCGLVSGTTTVREGVGD